MSPAQELALGFADCFYFDDFGQMGLRFRDLRFLPLYEEINTALGKGMKRYRFEPDNRRKFLIFATLLGIGFDSITWSIADNGQLVITKLCVPERLRVPGGIEGSALEYGNPEHAIELSEILPNPQDLLPNKAALGVRQWLNKKFGYDDIYKEITDIYSAIDKVLWHNNIQNEA